MCAVSAVGDNFRNNFPGKHPWYPNTGDGNWPYNPNPIKPPNAQPVFDPAYAPSPPPDLSKLATKEELEALRNDMVELKELLKAAIKYDEATAQPHCENEDKIRLIKEVATAVGVDISELKFD